jgi:rubrerythrin
LNRLIKSLRFAHAAEIAAYHAYEGHWRSVSNKAEQDYIRGIQLDELEHIHAIEDMLRALGGKPNRVLDKMGFVVGEIIGILCYRSGWRLPMYVAGAMEKIGTASYEKIAIEAWQSGQGWMALRLFQMAGVEQAHEDYFKTVRLQKERSNVRLLPGEQ